MTLRACGCAEEVVNHAVRGDETPINQGIFLDRGLTDGMRAAARHTPAARLKDAELIGSTASEYQHEEPEIHLGVRGLFLRQEAYN